MKYFFEKDGVELKREVYAEHFDTEIKREYWVCIDDIEGERFSDPKLLAKGLKKYAKRLLMISNFLEKIE